MLNELLLQSADRSRLAAVISQPRGSLLFTAPAGFGLSAVARATATEIVGVSKAHLNIKIVETGETKSISIETVRSIKSFFYLKTLEKAAWRVVVIEQAELMSQEAQNALLKILEEPPQNCFMILTSSAPDTLLPTIMSRVQSLMLKKPSLEICRQYFLNKRFRSQEIESALTLSDGLPGLTGELLSGQQSTMTSLIADAKKLLGSPMFEKLVLIEAYTKDRELCAQFLQALLKVSHAALKTSAHKPDGAAKWQSITRTVLYTSQLLAQNVNTKLALTHMVICL